MNHTIYRSHAVKRVIRPDGTITLDAKDPLGPVVEKTTDWLDDWSVKTPEQTFLAERSGPAWRKVTYLEARQMARAIAAGLLELELTPQTPIMIISGNSVDHGLLALAAQYVGIPIVPVAEQYALLPDAQKQLDYVAGLVKPGLIFGENGKSLGDCLQREAFRNARILVSHGARQGWSTLSQLASTKGDIASATASVGPDTIAKILLTSGSTSMPKGVLTTHRMLCTNQKQIAQALPFLQEKPPVIVDWLPWNHTFGGSHNFNMMLANGGSLYVDSGKPAPHLVAQTIENLRLKTGTLAFNVPVGFAMLRDVMRDDAVLRQAYFENLDMLFYAGASLPQEVWADLEQMARQVRGDMPLFTSSWGLTETAPGALIQHEPTDRSGIVGVPLPGMTVKLIPDSDMRCEVRVKGPNIFEAYLNDPQKTEQAFDEEGYFKTGDAMRFVDPDDPNLGLKFDGRISEDFKLLTGTWVQAANLRLSVLSMLQDVAADVVITGADRSEIGLLLVPNATAKGADDCTEDAGALISPSIERQIKSALAQQSGGSSTRVRRVLLLAEPPLISEGEITAKGNLNFAKILSRRAKLVDRLYNDHDPASIAIGEAP